MGPAHPIRARQQVRARVCVCVLCVCVLYLCARRVAGRSCASRCEVRRWGVTARSDLGDLSIELPLPFWSIPFVRFDHILIFLDSILFSSFRQSFDQHVHLPNSTRRHAAAPRGACAAAAWRLPLLDAPTQRAASRSRAPVHAGSIKSKCSGMLMSFIANASRPRAPVHAADVKVNVMSYESHSMSTLLGHSRRFTLGM